jgi:hypothetical protein
VEGSLPWEVSNGSERKKEEIEGQRKDVSDFEMGVRGRTVFA